MAEAGLGGVCCRPAWAGSGIVESAEIAGRGGHVDEADVSQAADLAKDLADQRDLDLAYWDRLHGTITDAFWSDCSARWEAERQRIADRLARHQQADRAYLELGVRLVDVASRAAELYRDGLAERGASSYRSSRTSRPGTGS